MSQPRPRACVLATLLAAALGAAPAIAGGAGFVQRLSNGEETFLLTERGDLYWRSRRAELRRICRDPANFQIALAGDHLVLLQENGELWMFDWFLDEASGRWRPLRASQDFDPATIRGLETSEDGAIVLVLEDRELLLQPPEDAAAGGSWLTPDHPEAP